MNAVFYCGDDQAKARALETQARVIWGEVHTLSHGNFRLLVPGRNKDLFCVAGDNYTAYLSGYVRKLGGVPVTTQTASTYAVHNRCLFEDILRNKWPPSADITGLFSCVVYDHTTDTLSLCNDVSGFYPLYYARSGGEVYGGTSLIILARACGLKPDLLGLLESISGVECTFGTRTLIHGIQRLQPGELLSMRGAAIIHASYDNRLYENITDQSLRSTAESVWEVMKEEVRACVGAERDFILGLSGGWDSRLILAALKDRSAPFRCFTVGEEEDYETHIARRLATLSRKEFRSFPLYGDYFPEKEALQSAVRATEQVHVSSWFSVTNHLMPEDENRVFLLGEAFEAVDGRNIASLQSREARIRNFVTRRLLLRDLPFEKATPASFKEWGDKKTTLLTGYLLRNYRQCVSDDVLSQLNESHVREEFREDLRVSLERIRQVSPPYTPLFDELFAWFYKSRGLTPRQQIQLNEKFVSIGPTSTVRLLRNLSNVHPRLRLGRNLMDQIARLPELRDVARIPSAQIPFVGATWPKVLREVVWGARSKADQVLIHRVMRTKDLAARQRIVPSTDYYRIYRDQRNRDILQSWFSERWIKSKFYLDVFDARANFRVWPLENIHMLSVASKSIILDHAVGNG